MGRLPTGTLTLLFSDIEGSTLMLSRLGERWGDALSAQRAILRAVFKTFDGYELGTEGDSFFVVFTSAGQALMAAVEGQRRLQGHDWPDGIPVKVRMGLHTGEPQRHEDGYIGLDVHRAARIAGTAGGCQVVLSEATRLLAGPLGDDVTVRDLGWHRLKDLVEPEHVHDLVVRGLVSQFSPLRSLGTKANLPTASTPLVGRDGELAELRQLIVLPDVRVLTLTGTGGSGKTRLALAIAAALEHEFQSGIFFADLQLADRAALMWLGIAAALDVAGDVEERPRERVRRFLVDRAALLVLDNLEQIADADSVVSDLLNAAPHVTVLATSRRPLHLVSEHEHAVPPLELPQGAASSPADAARSGAVELFVRRARMVRPAFMLTDANVADVVELCRRLDGLPLAIELAAARSKLLSPQALLSRLDHTLGSGIAATDRAERQRTLASTIAWSHDLLSQPEQVVFRRLGVFAGHYDLAAIETVAGTPGVDPLDTVGHLVDMSLLQIVDGPDGEPRISMLETIRAFARHRLETSDECDVVRMRHVAWCVERAAEVELLISGPGRIGALDSMSAIEGDVRAALDWSLAPIAGGDRERTERGIRLFTTMTTYWYQFGYAAEARGWFARALAVADSVEGIDTVHALHGMGVLHVQLGDFSPAIECLFRAAEMTRRLGEPDLEARELNSLGIAHRERGDLAEARTLIERSLDVARLAGSRRRESTALANLVIILLDAGDWQAAVDAAHRAVAMSRALGDEWAALIDDFNLTLALLRADGAEAAYAHLAEIAARAIALEDMELTISIVETFAAILSELGHVDLPAQLMAVADRQRSVAAMPRSGPDQAHLDRSFDASGARSDPRWRPAYEEGRGLEIGEAVEKAQSVRVRADEAARPREVTAQRGSADSGRARDEVRRPSTRAARTTYKACLMPKESARKPTSGGPARKAV